MPPSTRKPHIPVSALFGRNLEMHASAGACRSQQRRRGRNYTRVFDTNAKGCCSRWSTRGQRSLARRRHRQRLVHRWLRRRPVGCPRGPVRRCHPHALLEHDLKSRLGLIADCVRHGGRVRRGVLQLTRRQGHVNVFQRWPSAPTSESRQFGQRPGSRRLVKKRSQHRRHARMSGQRQQPAGASLGSLARPL